MELKSSEVKTLTRIAILVALATVLHIVEALIPVPYVVPGAKLGLANIVALYAVMTMGPGESLTISFLRTLLGSLFSGTFLNVAYYLSVSGALLSTGAMYVIKTIFDKKLSAVGISTIGSVTHNIGQLLVASLILRQIGVMFYLPYLLAFAIPTGIFTGLAAGRIIAYTENILNRH